MRGLILKSERRIGTAGNGGSDLQLGSYVREREHNIRWERLNSLDVCGESD